MNFLNTDKDNDVQIHNFHTPKNAEYLLIIWFIALWWAYNAAHCWVRPLLSSSSWQELSQINDRENSFPIPAIKDPEDASDVFLLIALGSTDFQNSK